MSIGEACTACYPIVQYGMEDKKDGLDAYTKSQAASITEITIPPTRYHTSHFLDHSYLSMKDVQIAHQQPTSLSVSH